MGNKGFAITGILYTLFVMFVMILMSILATISYKKGILEKTVLKLEDSFATSSVGTDLSNTYEKDASGVAKATIDARYEFYTKTNINGKEHELFCYAYLKKGETIPKNNIDPTNPNFILIPGDCNEHSLEIILETSTPTYDKFVLTNVYKFVEE